MVMWSVGIAQMSNTIKKENIIMLNLTTNNQLVINIVKL